MDTVDTTNQTATPDYRPQEYKIQSPNFAGAFAGEVAKGYLLGFGGYFVFDALTALPSLGADLFHEANIRGRQLQIQNSNHVFKKN